MKLIEEFHSPSAGHRPFRGWAGRISAWPEKSPPVVEFGEWRAAPGGGSVTFEAEPFQLCMVGANAKDMSPKDKFTRFAFAGLGKGGRLVLNRLPEGDDARALFLAGGMPRPATGDLVREIEAAATGEDLDALVEFCREFCTRIQQTCGMGLGHRAHEDDILSVLASWPQLMEVHSAFAGLMERREMMREDMRRDSAAKRLAAVRQAVDELHRAGQHATPVLVAARVMGIDVPVGADVPGAVKRKAAALEKEFAGEFAQREATA